MKVTNLFLAMSAAALVASCSNDEVVDVNYGETIQFNVTAGKPSRATATTTASIDNFKVWAFTQGAAYMNGYEVTKTDNKWTYGDTKFWPETKVDFFAVSPTNPTSGTVTVTNETKTITDYEVTAGTEDLLYAAEFDQEKKTDAVSINFRHALSQIVFRAKNTNSRLKVIVKGVTIEGVNSKGTLTWATKSTQNNLTTTENDTEVEGGTWGTWAYPETAALKNYDAVTLDNSVELTSTATDWDAQSLFLLPQTLNPWLSLNEDGEVKITGTARVLVDCQVIDVESGLVLHPKKSVDESEADGETETASETETATLTAPVAISLVNPSSDGRWKQGKKYIYTLVFGEGAGYEPDPDPEDPDPDPVLVPITLDVTVDLFQDGGDIDLSGGKFGGNNQSGSAE